jgi:hypothetical protein
VSATDQELVEAVRVLGPQAGPEAVVIYLMTQRLDRLVAAGALRRDDSNGYPGFTVAAAPSA